MAKKNVKRTAKNRLRVKYTEANRVRSLLLSDKTQMLSKRDVQTLVKILNDVYPLPKRKPRMLWQPLLVGIGIGLLLVIGVAVIV